MPRLIFINRFFHPDGSATSQLLGDLAFHLAGAGHDVSVITSRQLSGAPGRELPPNARFARILYPPTIRASSSA
ncbi:MAG: hypothetical protein JXP73_19625 [Deltaproteobacteria bacterium]|nr:hypothetical protein [Deltaproteobacteria bacterium]